MNKDIREEPVIDSNFQAGMRAVEKLLVQNSQACRARDDEGSAVVISTLGPLLIGVINRLEDLKTRIVALERKSRELV